MIRVQWILESTNQNIIGHIFPEVFKSESKGGNIAIVYTMIYYGLRVMYDECDTLKFSPMR